VLSNYRLDGRLCTVLEIISWKVLDSCRPVSNILSPESFPRHREVISIRAAEEELLQ
jgi:hypothetical protein